MLESISKKLQCCTEFISFIATVVWFWGFAHYKENWNANAYSITAWEKLITCIPLELPEESLMTSLGISWMNSLKTIDAGYIYRRRVQQTHVGIDHQGIYNFHIQSGLVPRFLRISRALCEEILRTSLRTSWMNSLKTIDAGYMATLFFSY